MKKVIVYGFGGHGKVITELLLESGIQWVGIFDDNFISPSNDKVKYLGSYSPQLHNDIPIILAIGNSSSRKALTELIKHPYFTFIHQSAYIAPSAKIEEGTVVLQGAIIQSNSIIGKHCIVNINASIDHDTSISDFVHIAPHSYIGSNSTISGLNDLIPGQILPRFTNI